MWYRWVVDIGFTGPDEGRGGEYLLLPPGYKGEVPDGYFIVRSPTFSDPLLPNELAMRSVPAVQLEAFFT